MKYRRNRTLESIKEIISHILEDKKRALEMSAKERDNYALYAGDLDESIFSFARRAGPHDFYARDVDPSPFIEWSTKELIAIYSFKPGTDQYHKDFWTDQRMAKKLNIPAIQINLDTDDPFAKGAWRIDGWKTDFEGFVDFERKLRKEPLLGDER